MSTRDPYAPPATPVADAPEVMVKARKPIAIWLLQILCAIAAAFCVSGLIQTLSRVIELWSSKPSIEKYATMATGVLQFTAVALFLIVVIGAQRRSSVARWLSLLLLSGFFLIALLGVIKTAPGSDLNTARTLGYYLGLVTVLGTPALLLWFSCFSKRARAWYSKTPAVEATATPPAPA